MPVTQFWQKRSTRGISLGGTGSILMFIFGFPGMIDDFGSWARLLKTDSARTVLTIVGLVLIALALYFSVKRPGGQSPAPRSPASGAGGDTYTAVARGNRAVAVGRFEHTVINSSEPELAYSEKRTETSDGSFVTAYVLTLTNVGGSTLYIGAKASTINHVELGRVGGGALQMNRDPYLVNGVWWKICDRPPNALEFVVRTTADEQVELEHTWDVRPW